MVITDCASASSAFDHILDNVLGGIQPQEGSFNEGMRDIYHLSTLKDDVIDGLQYEDKTSFTTLILCKKVDKIIIMCFLAYEEHLGQEGFNGDYNSITQVSFDQFRISSKLESAQLHQLLALAYTPLLEWRAFGLPFSSTLPV
jgi:hypothetical protein